VSAPLPGPRPELAGLTIADAPELWTTLGFTVAEGRLVLGGIEVRLGGEGHGITGWTLRHLPAVIDVDGLPTAVTADPAPAAVPTGHPNDALGIDQVVITTPDFDRTAAALDAAGMPLRRIREVGSYRQGFRRLGPAILELVEARTSSPTDGEPNTAGSGREGDAPAGPARFWGLVVVVPDLPGLRRRLSPHVSEIRDAVQPGRHIAALSATAGLSPRVAFMDPE
jgi:hypothetical protein